MTWLAPVVLDQKVPMQAGANLAPARQEIVALLESVRNRPMSAQKERCNAEGAKKPH